MFNGLMANDDEDDNLNYTWILNKNIKEPYVWVKG